MVKDVLVLELILDKEQGQDSEGAKQAERTEVEGQLAGVSKTLFSAG